MQRRMSTRALMLIVLMIAGIGLALGPQLSRPMQTSAQSVVTATPLVACGTISTITEPTATSAGSITLTNTDGSLTFTIAAGVSVTGTVPQSQGSDVCLVGTINASNQLIAATLWPDQSPTLNICATVTAYTAATQSTLGSITVGGKAIPIAFGATFAGTVPLNTDVCAQLTLNGMGQVTGGSFPANTTSQASTLLPVSICGAVSGYTAATSTAPGSLSLSTTNVNASYTIPAGTSLSFTPQSTQQLCMIGSVTAANAIQTVTLLSNVTSTITLCGVVSAYTAATTTTRGALTINGNVVPTAYGATFSGTDLAASATAHSNVCVAATVNGVGELVTGNVSPNQNVTVTPTSTPGGNPGPPPPPPPGGSTATPTPTITPTPTNTPVPPTATPTPTATATFTPSPTATPLPPPPYKPTFSIVTVKYPTMRIGTVETVSIVTRKKAKHGIAMRVFFATGRQLSFKGTTSSSGQWSKSFTVPTNTISQYSHLAVIMLDLTYKGKITRTYRTFTVIR